MHISLASHYFELVVYFILYIYVSSGFFYRLKDPLLRIFYYHSFSICCSDFGFVEPATIEDCLAKLLSKYYDYLNVYDSSCDLIVGHVMVISIVVYLANKG